MAEYAQLDDVRARLPFRVIDATTSQPSEASVQGWLDEAEIELNRTLSSVGLPAPYTDADSKTILGIHVAEYAEARVRMAYAGGDPANEDGKDLMEQWRAMLRDIRKDPETWYEKLAPTSMAPTPGAATQLRSHITHSGFKPRSNRPHFTRNEGF